MITAYLLTIPYLRAVGGLLLAWIAVKVLKQEDGKGHKEAPGSLRQAIQTIIIADFLMSLDNVLAVAGASRGNVNLLIFGLLLSIPLVIWGSILISKLMTKWPWVISLGAGLLGWTAGEMLIQEPFLAPLHENAIAGYLIPGMFAVGVILIGKLRTTKPDISIEQEAKSQTVSK